MANSKKLIHFIAAFVFILAITACKGDKTSGNQKNSASSKSVSEMQCMAQQTPCQFDVEGGRIDVLFDVSKVVAEQAFNMSVRYTGNKTINTVNGYMEGVEMYMGKIPLFFESTATSPSLDNTIKTQVFQGEVLVGSCSAKTMTWKIWLSLTDSDNKVTTKMLTIVSHSR